MKFFKFENAGLGLAIFAGLVLRLHGIRGQVLMDDEWHSMLMAEKFPFVVLFTHLGHGATCIPLNVYQKILLETVGWNETVLRLPTILGGCLCLVIFPFLVGALFNRRVATIFTILFALSPYLVFTTRYSRPYSIYLFLSFSAIWAFYMWVLSGRRKYRVAYVLAGALAVYFHLFAVIAITVPPLLALAGASWSKRMEKSPESIGARVSSQKIAVTFGVCLALIAILLCPAFFNTFGRFLSNHPRMDPPTAASFTGFASLATGSSMRGAVALFCLLWLWGLVFLIRNHRFLGGLFIATMFSYLLAIVICATDKMSNPIQIARYGIPVFPMIFICVSLSLDRGLTACFRKISVDRFPTGWDPGGIVILCLGVVLFLIGPLPESQGGINNFTNHAAYQESYEPLKWDRPYHSQVSPFMTLRKEEMSEFYRLLEKEGGDPVIVEYPMLPGFHLNIYYFYQHFHRKRVMMGYIGNLPHPPIHGAGDVFYGDQPLDFLLSLVKDKSKLKFSNMVDLADLSAVAKSGAHYVVIHKNLLAEEVGERSFALAYQPAISLETLCRKKFGNPVFKDCWLTVFEIPGFSASFPFAAGVPSFSDFARGSAR